MCADYLRSVAWLFSTVAKWSGSMRVYSCVHMQGIYIILVDTQKRKMKENKGKEYGEGERGISGVISSREK